jgi:aldehyde:ferredoxin oxidoreductase
MCAAPCGYHGRYLRIDLTSSAHELVALDSDVLRRFLGGVGLGAWILSQEMEVGTEPLGAGAALVFVFSPLVGSPLTTSAKFAVVAMSPLTGRLCDALSSSHFALAGKRTGLDAIVLKGSSPRPVVVLVDGLDCKEPAVEVIPATDYVGKSAAQAESGLRERLGSEWQVASIGPAGESLIPFATISHDGRHAGRGGLGAVLGSKGVKALAVRGDRRTRIFDTDRTMTLARDLSARSFGPATEKYRTLGTLANLLVFNRFDALPTRNFASGRFEGAEQLAAFDLAPARKIARNSCAACTIGCEHIYEIVKPEGGNASRSAGVRMEYESLYALGPLCGVSDPQSVLRAAALCDELGVDTISTGGTAAFLMDCAQRGWIEGLLPSGKRLRFGDAESLIEAIEVTVSRQGLGALMALGTRRAAAVLGGEAPARAMHVKGLELPGYDPRVLHAMALGLAVATRGADHNRSGAYEADFSNAADRREGNATTAALAIETEDKAALIDSLILCKFLRGVFSDLFSESAQMLAAVTGWDVTADELRGTARAIIDLRKSINQAAGWTRAEDTLPDALFSEEMPGLSRQRLESMIDAYYHLRGWDACGIVPEARRYGLGISIGGTSPAGFEAP